MAGVSISIAMCTYNGARFLLQQLESIAAQTRLPDELVICDDRSVDESSEIVKRFARRAPFAVRWHVNENNLGSTKNFEKAISLCNGEIIVLSDQDDVWLGQKLERISAVFEGSEEVGAVFSDGELIDENSQPLDQLLWNTWFFSPNQQRCFANGQALDVMLKHPVVTGATLAFRTRFCPLLLPIPANHVHDRWIAFLLAACTRFVPVAIPLIKYRQHTRQQIGAGTRTFVRQIEIAWRTGQREYLFEINSLRQICERLEEQGAQFQCPASAAQRIREKISHCCARASLSPSRLSRLPTVLRECANLRYCRYSDGWKSVAKDILFQRGTFEAEDFGPCAS